jgi:hypothetical protein
MKSRDTYLKRISVEMETMQERQPDVEHGHHRTKNLDDDVYGRHEALRPCDRLDFLSLERSSWLS